MAAAPIAATSKLSTKPTIFVRLSAAAQLLSLSTFFLPFVALTSHAMGRKKKPHKTSRLASAPRKPGADLPLGRVPAWRASWPWLCLGLALLFIVGVRIRLLWVPLEGDEGEFAYAGQLILEGIPPYQLAYNVKLPGICAAYALVMAVFGQTPIGIHLGLLFVNL